MSDNGSAQVSAAGAALERARKFKPGFMFADQFLRNLTFYRVLYCEGRLGGGKTLLSVACSHWLLANGKIDKIWCNFPMLFSVPVEGETTNTGMILDESWAFANRMRDAISYAAHLRHRNSYLFLPSVFPPHALLRRFRVRRERNFALFGINLWLYKWRIKEYNVEGHFLLKFRRYFDTYDTSFEPASDWGIGGVLQRSIKTQLDGLPEDDYVEFTQGVEEFHDAVVKQGQNESRSRRKRR